MSRFLVTGGAGFIGSHIVDRLVGADHEVVVVDCLHPGAHAAEPDYLNPAARFVRADVRDRDAMRALAASGFDGVCHQAARVGLGVDFDDAPGYVADNDEGTAALLWALHHAAFTGRIVLASSMVVYGEGRYRCDEHGLVRPGQRRRKDLDSGNFEPPCPGCGRSLTPESVPEDAPVDPRNVYAATKLHQEHLATAFAIEHATPLTSLRYHNVYGSRMPRDTPYAGVASIFRSSLESGNAPRVFEDGRQRRDFVDVRDVARANVIALTAAGPVPGVFNVASGVPHTVGEMAAALAAAFDGSFDGGAPEVEVVGGYRIGDVRHVFASAQRARDELGFHAEIDFAAGMHDFATAPLREPAERS